MENILLLDTSIASLNRGDDIIMECVKDELEFVTKSNFVLNLPTHLAPFHFHQVLRNSPRLQAYKNCKLKFAGGTNLLISNLLTHFPQWNLNILDYSTVKGCILVGVGKGPGERTNKYTISLYKKLLNKEYYHSVRDERSKSFLESIGLMAINTGCISMWALTPAHCKKIPQNKSSQVVFTLTGVFKRDERDQELINILNDNYSKVYFWVQGIQDYMYLNKFNNIQNINIVGPTVKEFKQILRLNDIEYVGTRLHAGIYAMRHKKRAIIFAIDERARGINESNNLNCAEKDEIETLPELINSDFATDICMPFDEIEKWKAQFK